MAQSSIRRNLITVGVFGLSSYLAYKAFARERATRFHDETVVISGGSRGLGLVLARQFAMKGAKIVLLARNTQELERARTQIIDLGAPVLAIPCDVTNADDVRNAISMVEETFGIVDVLVNNAGIIQVGPYENMTRGDFEKAMRIHFWAPYNLVNAVVPLMRSQGGGRIINISSIGGAIAVPHMLPYTVSKFALSGFSEGIQAELAKDGIYVTTVFPGPMRTGSPRQAFFKGQNRLEFSWFAITASVPFLSISAERAAKKIIEASGRGQRFLVVSAPAKIAIKFYQMFPELSARIADIVNRLLPRPTADSMRIKRGAESRSYLTPPFLTVLTDRAARRNNEGCQALFPDAGGRQ